jgi:hypothetical protein
MCFISFRSLTSLHFVFAGLDCCEQKSIPWTPLGKGDVDGSSLSLFSPLGEGVVEFLSVLGDARIVPNETSDGDDRIPGSPESVLFFICRVVESNSIDFDLGFWLELNRRVIGHRHDMANYGAAVETAALGPTKGS